jgi:hypothetical protein
MEELEDLDRDHQQQQHAEPEEVEEGVQAGESRQRQIGSGHKSHWKKLNKLKLANSEKKFKKIEKQKFIKNPEGIK